MQWKTNTESFQTLTAEVKGAYNGIVDTGATLCAVPDASLCKPGSLYSIPEPRVLGGIAGGLIIEQMGLLEAEFIDLKGRIKTIEVPTIVHPELPGIILESSSPDGKCCSGQSQGPFQNLS